MAATDPTLLLQDLLSPPSPAYPPPTLLRQLSYHLAPLPLRPPHLELIKLLVQSTASSRAIWTAPAEPTQRFERLQRAFEAIRQGVLLRLDQLSRPKSEGTRRTPDDRGGGGGGWSARRDLHAFLAAFSAGLWADAGALTWGEGVEPNVRLALSSGVLSALQEWKRNKGKLWVGGGKGIEGCEREVGKAWEGWSEAMQAGGDFPAWAAAQTLPSISAETLAQSFPVAAALRCLTDSFSSTFASGEAFSSPPLSPDLSQTAEGLSWAAPSPSHSHLTALVTAPLLTALGPLSRAVGRAVEAAAILSRSSALNSGAAHSSLRHLSTTLLAISSKLSAGWATTPWSDLLDDSSLSPSTRSQTAPWTLLKTLLFSQTLIYSSLLQVVSYTRSKGDEPTVLQRELAIQAVQALGKTYFVALKFGQSGFEAWRAVLAGLVEVAAAGRSHDENAEDVSPVVGLVRSLDARGGTGTGGIHDRAVERAEVTFWMNTVEQVMRDLGDEYVERRVLRGIRPYLDDARYRESFEAAHSVLLAIFAANKRCIVDIAPWYTALLLRTYPSLLSPTQFRLAFSTMVDGVCSAGDDALAWWNIQELLAAAEALPVAASMPSLDPADVAALPSGNTAFAPSAPPPPALPNLSPDTAGSATPLDTRALTLPRGGYLLALSSLLPSVSLPLLPPLLSILEDLLRAELPDHDGRSAVVEFVFEVIGEGMDARKREVGVEWWMERGGELMRGTNLERRERVLVGGEGGRADADVAEEQGDSGGKEEVEVS
ncbi:hypothetical protein JCM11641_001135 [Rhodosporidiobolus odoratus]